MRISLFGYGKMGKAIERIAVDRGHDIVQRIGSANAGETPHNNADVVIEFSIPSTAANNIESCVYAEKPIVVGTTGWLNELGRISDLVHEKNGAMLWASNFSIGVNIFFEVNRRLAHLMNDRAEYSALVEETHHIHKLDAPSGTGITIAEDLVSEVDRYSKWSEETDEGALEVRSYREGEVPGTHKVTYSSPIDDISIEHKAHNREGFAMGAVLAAEWLVDKKGVFTMKDLLKL